MKCKVYIFYLSLHPLLYVVCVSGECSSGCSDLSDHCLLADVTRSHVLFHVLAQSSSHSR